MIPQAVLSQKSQSGPTRMSVHLAKSSKVALLAIESPCLPRLQCLFMDLLIVTLADPPKSIRR